MRIASVAWCREVSLPPPRTYYHRGSQAVLADPQGAVFAVLASSTGDSPDYLRRTRRVIWSSLLTADPSTQRGLLQSRLRLPSTFDLPSDDDAQHIDSARATTTRAPAYTRSPRDTGIRTGSTSCASSTPSRPPPKPSHSEAACWLQPFLDRHGGHVAVIADPYGAPLGLLEWTAAGQQSGSRHYRRARARPPSGMPP